MRLLVPLIGLAACGGVEPTLTSVTPDLVCDEVEGGTTLTLVGTDFTAVAADVLTGAPRLLPAEVVFHPAGGLGQGQSALATDPVFAQPSRVRPISPERIEVFVDGGLGLESGTWDVEVRNPNQRSTVLPAGLLVAAPPMIDAVDPGGVCQRAAAVELALRGSGYLVFGDTIPSVQVGGVEVEIVGLDDCVGLAGGRDGQVCSTVRVRVEPTALPLGPIEIEVSNPAPATCGGRRGVLEVLRPSTVTSVEPADVCREGDAFDVRGTNLLPGTEVWLGDHAATVEPIDWTHLRVTPGPGTPPGQYDLDVRPPQGCPFVVDHAVNVHPTPIVFDVSPPSVWSGMNTTVTARVSDVIRDVDDAWLVDESGSRVDVAWSWDEDTPSLVQLTVPRGADVGDYQVHLSQEGSCSSQPAASVAVVTELGIALGAIEPGFAWTYAPTPVQILAESPIPTGQAGLEGPPAFWLVGPDDSPGTTAIIGTDPRSDDLVNAVLPEGLAAGRYSVLAVNDAGAVGVLPGAVQVGLEPPPTVSSIAPATLANRVDAEITIRGRDFRDPTVRFTCREDRSESTVSATVVSWAWGEIEATVPANLFGSAVCVVRVENADGTSVDWAAVTITNPAQNLLPWRSGPELVEARRAPAVAAGRTTSVSRWAFVLGGDAGSDDTAMRSVEHAPLGVYGDVGDWSVLPRPMPAPRTRAGIARVGRFVYLVGGHDGTAPVDTLWRAEILDPLQVPRFAGLDVQTTTSGLTAGQWTYRISAVFPPDYPANPGGESLPSEPIRVTLPDAMTPTLSWTRVENAVAYRIYRTRAADDDPTSAVVLTDVIGTTRFTDDGTATPGSRVPLSQGSLGSWANSRRMSVARSSPCVALAPDPEPDPERVWLYVAGGVGPDGTELDSIEMIDIEIRGPQQQNVGVWKDPGVTLSAPRAECGGFVVDSEMHTVVDDGEAWVFFAGGKADRSTTGITDRGQVGRGGELLGWSAITPLKQARAGFGVLSASNFLYTFGGAQGRPTESGASASLSEFPDVKNWNSLGVSMAEARYLPGSARESAVVLVVGGETDGEAASHFVDWTNW